MMKRFIIVLLSLLMFENTFASEDSVYTFSWLDPDKEVFVLQNRKFRKNGRMYVSLGGGITTSGAFVDSKTIQGRFGFFFKEEWGFEGIYAKNSGEENETATSVRNEGSAGSRPFRRIVDNYMGGMILWSPFYSKINTFNSIVYIDWLIGLGYAKLEETNNRDEFITGLDGQVSSTDSHNGIMWDIGLKFYISESLSARTDLTAIHYQASKASTTSTEKTYYTNYDLAFSLGYTF